MIHGDIRTAFYFQSWSPKSDPVNSIPLDHGSFASLDKALREASHWEIDNPNSFVAEIYSYNEKWISEEEYYKGQLIKAGYWQVIEGTLVMYNRKGEQIFRD